MVSKQTKTPSLQILVRTIVQTRKTCFIYFMFFWIDSYSLNSRTRNLVNFRTRNLVNFTSKKRYTSFTFRYLFDVLNTIYIYWIIILWNIAVVSRLCKKCRLLQKWLHQRHSGYICNRNKKNIFLRYESSQDIS